MSESDGVEEALTSTGRMALTSAARIGEALARVRQQWAQDAAGESAARAQDLAARMEAQREVARTTFRGVDDSQWWAQAEPDDVAEAYRNAVAWREVDPAAARAEERISEEVRNRYGVDVRATEAGQLGPQLSNAADDLARRSDIDLAEAGALLGAADRADQLGNSTEADVDREQLREAVLTGNMTPEELAEQWPQDAPFRHLDEATAEAYQGQGAELEAQSDISWDSAERRAATARDLAGRVGDPHAVDARMRADVAQGKPATEATHGSRPGTKARPGRGTSGRQRTRQRGLSR